MGAAVQGAPVLFVPPIFHVDKEINPIPTAIPVTMTVF
jgi:hypothetical protein